MTTKRMFWLLFALVGFLVVQVYTSCGPGETTKEPGQETTTTQEGQKESAPSEKTSGTEPVNEGGGNEPSVGTESGSEGTSGVEPGQEPASEPGTSDSGTETTPETPVTEQPQDQSSGGVQVSFSPKSGSQIGVKDVCIDVTFSTAIDKNSWEVTWTAQGGQSSTLLLPLDSGATSARICFQDYLTQSTQYTLTVKVQDAGLTASGLGTATYTTTDPYKSGKTGDPGLTVNLQLDKILEPSLVNALLGSIDKNQILPILMHLHSRDTGTSGDIVMIGGLGRTPSGNPHLGKDVFDNQKDAVSVLMKGKFQGNLFTAGPATFRVSLGAINLTLEQFRLSGLFNAAGDGFTDVRFSGLVDSVPLKAALGLDACTLVVGKCFKDKSGRTVLMMVGQMKAIVNPITYSALITAPLFLDTGVATKPSLELYMTEATDATSVATVWSTCANSGDPNLPCDTSKGAVLTGATVTNTATLDATKKIATIAVTSTLTASTWYRVAVTAKSSKGTSYTTFTIFKTQ